MTPSSLAKGLSLQDIIQKLQSFWAEQGCALLQPYDMEVGAGTFHWATTLRALGPDPWSAAYVQPSRRPTDGRYGQNPFRLQHYYQFQVLLKPSPSNSPELLLKSLRAIGIDDRMHDVRFNEDDWKSPTLGAVGVGWEITCDGMEIAQFTYFQRVCGIDCERVSTELTYGLERLAMFVQDCHNVFDLRYNENLTYRDVFGRSEREFSVYNFEKANIDLLRSAFDAAEREGQSLLNAGLCLPAYDQCLKCSHLMNLLDARGSITTTDREDLIERVACLARRCGDVYLHDGEEIQAK